LRKKAAVSIRIRVVSNCVWVGGVQPAEMQPADRAKRFCELYPESTVAVDGNRLSGGVDECICIFRTGTQGKGVS
jgi:hypothetical protein